VSVAHTVRLHEPRVGEHDVLFAWDVSPRSALYLSNEFTLSFPAGLDIAAVPTGLWLRLALICLHPHWALLRPCRVELPYYLGPGEREFWLRLLDTVAIQVEAYGGERREGRAAELFDDGPSLRPTPIRAERAGVAAAFSGGKDSLVQSALLAELAPRPTLVTTTSPVPWAHDHVGSAREHTLAEIPSRLPVDLVEVTSDFRACWDNDFAGLEGSLITVNELTDVLLYQAVTVAVAAASGISRSFLASEADLQYNASIGGDVIQHGHFASAAVTQAALDAILSGFGLRLGSLTYPLHMPQVQGLLWRRYRELTDLQFSCWEAGDGSRACGRCAQCIEVALVVLDEGFSPRVAGIDPVRVLCAWADPRPDPLRGRTPSLHPTRRARDKLIRVLQRMPPELVASILSEDPIAREDPHLAQAIAGYRRLRARSLPHVVPPEPGYIGGFLELIDSEFRDRLRAIFDQHFAAAPAQEFAATVSRSRSLARWIAAPLQGLHGP
jgi:hypothetical protein